MKVVVCSSLYAPDFLFLYLILAGKEEVLQCIATYCSAAGMVLFLAVPLVDQRSSFLLKLFLVCNMSSGGQSFRST